MKSRQPATNEPKDSPSTRKRRLRQRLQELSERSDHELVTLMKSVEKMKLSLRKNRHKHL